MQWELIRENEGRPGSENMAVDQALLEDSARTGRAFLRLYRWTPSCLSFGRNEPALTRYDRVEIERRGMDVVRRPTGGRAVWHQHEVTYAVAAPAGALGSLAESYCAIHERLARALTALGARATLAPRRREVALDQGAGACFSSAAGGEVLVDGKKVIGSAQVRERGALLQHGSILLADDQPMIASLRIAPGTPGPEPAEAPAPRPAATLDAALGRSVRFDEVADALEISLHDALRASAVITPLEPALLGGDLARLVIAFRDPAWTWRR